MRPLNFVVIGIGGYSLVHMEAIHWLAEQGLARLTGVVALKAEQKSKPDLIKSLQDQGIPLYETIDDFFSAGTKNIDVLTVPIGIHMHVPVSIRAMRAGLDVYCEKPIAATIQEADELIQVKKETGKRIAIGFQHIYSHSIRTLKQRICDNQLGAVKSVKLICGWPRSRQYYKRNSWAGKLKMDGKWILDSPANNAHAHYLLNALYLASPLPDRSANPVSIRSELYRANHIESTDLVQLKFIADTGTAFNVILTHCNWQEFGPIMTIKCEKGEITWQTDNGKTQIQYQNGETEAFDNLTHDKWRYDGFKDFAQSIHHHKEPICTPELARPHTITINAMHESCPEIVQIPDEWITEMEDWEMFPPDTRGNFRRVNDLDEYIQRSFDEDIFLSEQGIPWACQIQSERLTISHYDCFPKSDKKFVI